MSSYRSMKSMIHLRQASMDCAAQAASNYQSLRSLGEESRKLCSLASHSRKWNKKNELEDEYYDMNEEYGNIAEEMAYSSNGRSPLRASHEFYNNQETDSGFDNSANSNRLRNSFNRPFTPPLGYSRAQSECGRKTMSDRAVGDLQRILEESEHRRTMLMEKLREAQDTIQMQAKRLGETETILKDNEFEMNDLRFKTKEQKQKLEIYEQDKDSYFTLRSEHARLKEDMQNKVENLEIELASMRTQTSLAQAEAKKKQELLEQSSLSIAHLNSDNAKLAQAKDSLMRETNALKESLELSRSRNDWWESQNREHNGETDRLREQARTLLSQNNDLSKQLSDARRTNTELKGEVSTEKKANEDLKAEKQRVSSDLEALEKSIAGMKATTSTACSDKERYFQEKLQLQHQLQDSIAESEQLKKSKSQLEERFEEVSQELDRITNDTASKRTQQNKIDEELAAVKKVSEVLSIELATTKANLEKATEQNKSLEQSKTIAFEQHGLYEQEIQSLEMQIENMKKSMDSMKRDYRKEKDGVGEHAQKLREELRSLKVERNQLESKCHELESSLKQAETNLKDHSSEQLKEIDNWKSNVEKLTASTSRKDSEIQNLNKRIQEMEIEIDFLKNDQSGFRSQYEDLMEAKETNTRLVEENRRLVQERAENQQLIQLLEMQKSILAKTSEGTLSKIHDAEQLQCKVNQLTAENDLLQDKLKEAERIKDNLIKQKEERLADSDLFLTQAGQESFNKQLESLDNERKALADLNSKITEQLTRLEQENFNLKSMMETSVSKTDLRRVELDKNSLEEDVERWKKQFDQLEKRHHELLKDKSRNTTSDNETSKLKSQIKLLESSRKRVEEELEVLKRTRNENGAGEINRLQGELIEAKTHITRQDSLIRSFKEQSLDDAGSELSQVRDELNKLMLLMQVKEGEIEDLDTQLRDAKKEIDRKDSEVRKLRASFESRQKNDENIIEDCRTENEQIAQLQRQKQGIKLWNNQGF